MARYQKTVFVEAVTFEELVAFGVSLEVPCVDGYPWSFNYQAHAVTHENNNLYLINTPGKTLRLGRGDVLITNEHGALSIEPRAVFETNYGSLEPKDPAPLPDPNWPEAREFHETEPEMLPEPWKDPEPEISPEAQPEPTPEPEVAPEPAPEPAKMPELEFVPEPEAVSPLPEVEFLPAPEVVQIVEAMPEDEAPVNKQPRKRK